MQLYKKILCPTDFSELSLKAVSSAYELAAQNSAELDILHVVESVPVIASPTNPALFNVREYQEELKIHYQHSLDELNNEIKKRTGGRVAGKPVVLEGDAAREIIRFATEKGHDLIVITTHGRTGLSHLLYGSVTEKVVRSAPCSVLTIRSTAADS